MSARNGDKSRYGRTRKQKLLRRKVNRKLFKYEAGKASPTGESKSRQ